MVKRVVTTLIDDLDQSSEAEETVRFGLDGMAYTIDLTGEHAADLRVALKKYIAAGQKVVAPRLQGSGRNTGAMGTRPAAGWVTASPDYREQYATVTEQAARKAKYNREVREWARHKGIEVADRGALRTDLIERFEAEKTAKQNRAAVAANGAKQKSKSGDDDGMFLAATDGTPAAATGILANVEPKRTVIPPTKRTRARATSSKVVEPEPEKTTRRRRRVA